MHRLDTQGKGGYDVVPQPYCASTRGLRRLAHSPTHITFSPLMRKMWQVYSQPQKYLPGTIQYGTVFARTMIHKTPLPNNIEQRLGSLGQALDRCPRILFAYLFGGGRSVTAQAPQRRRCGRLSRRIG